MAISIKKQSRDLNSDSLALKVATALRHPSDLALEGAGTLGVKDLSHSWRVDRKYSTHGYLREVPDKAAGNQIQVLLYLPQERNMQATKKEATTRTS